MKFCGGGIENLEESAATLDDLTELLLENGTLGEAECLYREKLEIVRCSNENIDCARKEALAVFGLAAVVRVNGKIDEAEELYRECLEKYRKLCEDGCGSKNVAIAAGKLVDLLQQKESLDEAVLFAGSDCRSRDV